MERMFFELIQVSLGTREKLSRVPSDAQWEALFDEADRQAIVGILLGGIQRLKVKGEECLVNMSADLLLEWSCSAEMIKDQNKHLDQQTAEVWKMLKEAGLEAVVLNDDRRYQYKRFLKLRHHMAHGSHLLLSILTYEYSFLRPDGGKRQSRVLWRRERTKESSTPDPTYPSGASKFSKNDVQ